MEKLLNESLYNFALLLLLEANDSVHWNEAQTKGGQHVACNPNMHWLQARHIKRLADSCGVPELEWVEDGWRFKGVAEEIDSSVRDDVVEGEVVE